MSMYASALQGATTQVQPISECIKIQHLALISLSGSSYKWRTLVELLGLPFSKLQSLAADHRDKFEECCQAVLGQWLENPPPD